MAQTDGGGKAAMPEYAEWELRSLGDLPVLDAASLAAMPGLISTDFGCRRAGRPVEKEPAGAPRRQYSDRQDRPADFRRDRP